MKWNENDTKYIFKRLLLYLIITGIIFFTGTRCAKAEVVSVYRYSNCQDPQICQATGRGESRVGLTSTIFVNKGQGEVIFTLYIAPGQAPQDPIYEVSIGNSNAVYMCDISNQTWYYDNSTQRMVITAKCPVNTGSGLTYINLYNRESRTIYFNLSHYITFVSEQSDASAIVNGINSTLQQQITQGNTNTQAIVDSVNGMIYYQNQNANQAHNDSQAEQQAINNNTQAINDLNDNIMQDYEVPDDIESDFEFSEWFSQEDSDFIRGILLFPFRIFTLISGALDSNTCIEYSFGRLFGYELKLPCINYKQYIGNAIYIIIDTVFALVIVFGLIRYMISVYDFVFSIGLKGASVVAAVEVFK